MKKYGWLLLLGLLFSLLVACDNDPAINAVKVSPGIKFPPNISIAPDVTQRNITVSLRSEPTGIVQIRIQSSSAALSVSPGILVFDDSDWNLDQQVVVTRVGDPPPSNSNPIPVTISVDTENTDAPEYAELTAADIGVLEVTLHGSAPPPM